MAVKKIEIQDSVGDVYHPHTTTDVVFEGNENLITILKKLIKKDGSVPMTGALNFLNAPHKGIEFGEHQIFGDGDSSIIVNIAGIDRYRISPDGMFPIGGSEDLDLGSTNNTWNDVWVGDSNKSTNGYCKLTNGMIIQWGYRFLTTHSTGWHGADEIFPVAFPNSVLNVSVTAYSGQSNMQYGIATCGQSTTTGLHVFAKTESIGNIGIYYEVLGY